MSSFMVMPVDKLLNLARTCVARIDESNKQELAKAIANYRRGWWIFKPSKDLTDVEIECRLREDFMYTNHGGYARGIAMNLVKALEYALPDSTVFVSIEDFGHIV